ncbi:MAG: hypothetical protein AAF297_12160 [Planctomycetota bacterium]
MTDEQAEPPIVSAARQLCWEMTTAWAIWKGLFRPVDDENPAVRYRLLKRGGPLMTWIHWNSLTTVVIALGRFCDPPEMHRKKNLSVPHLISHLREFSGGAKVDDIEKDWSTLHSKWDSLKDIRNQRLAHNDLEIAISDQRFSIPTEEVGEAVRLVVRIVDAFIFRMTKSGTQWDMSREMRLRGVLWTLHCAETLSTVERMRWGQATDAEVVEFMVECKRDFDSMFPPPSNRLKDEFAPFLITEP